MKKVMLYAVGLLLCAVLLAVWPVQGEEGIYDNVIRLHILANSDSQEDQALKLAVRDALLSTYGEALDCSSEAGAEEKIRALLPEIVATAQSVVDAQGYGYRVRISFTEEAYPTRTYGDLCFPAGVYRSLRVMIGEGVGQNWWCVLFPPLCVGAATEDTPLPDDAPNGLTDSQWKLVSADGRYEVRFRLLEWIENLG